MPPHWWFQLVLGVAWIDAFDATDRRRIQLNF
jgi:hypothetical protein